MTLVFGLSASVTQYLPTLLSQASPIYPPKTANDPCHPNSDLNWINDNEIFKNWLAGRNTSILHVHGTSGVSNVGEHIFQHLNSTIDFLSDHSVLYFEFKQHDARFNTMKSMLSTFLAQIISHYTNLEERVVRNFELLVHYRCWTNKDLYAFLEDLRATRKIDGITYVINGLDQCDDSRAWFLAELVSIARYSESRYKVIITSTGSKEIEDILSESRTINLDDHRKTDSPSPDASFSNVGFELALLFQERPEYCAFEVTLGELLSGCDTDLRSLILDWLTFNDHSTTKSAIEERLQKLSPVFLQNVLETIVTSIDLERQAWARRIIAMVSCSFRPLTIWELRATLALDTYPEGRETDPLVFLDILAEFRRHFGSLFAFKSGEIYFGHPFARDFFIPSESYTSQARRWFEFEGQEIAHAEITSFCLNYLSLPEVKKQANEIVAQHISLPQCPVFDSRFDLLSYATRYWPDHYKLAISTNPESESVKLTTQAVTKFFGDTDAVLLWARFHHFLSNPAIRPEKPLSSSLSILSSFGFDGFIAQKILLLDHSVEPGNFSLALVEAARGDHVETLLLLLKRFTPSQPTLQDAIKAAASCSGENSLLVLLEYASGSVEKVEWLPDLLCRAAWLGLENVVTYLVRSGAEPNPPTPFHGMSPLHLAARNKHTSVANVLLKRNASLTCKALSGENVLQTACIYGHPEIVRLVAQAKSDLETEDEAGSVPLHYACRNGHHQVVKVMLEAGADKNRGKKGIQPLITTTKRGYIECCRSLLKYGANVKVKPDDYPPILQLAVDVGSVELVKLFVDHGAEIDEEDGNTTALSCAAQNGSTDIVTYLIQGNADVNRPKEAEFSPVYLAACNGHADILESLVKAGADVNTMSSDDGRGPLHIAYDFPDVARVLLKNGAELNRASSSRPPLLLASRHNYPEVVKVYLQYKPNLEIEHPNGMTALSMATAQGNSEIVRLLLEAGANVNHLTQNKEFPLQYCLAGFNDFKEDILRALLEYSPSLNLVDADGDTALNCLTPETPVSFIRLLINAGADPEICNKSGWTPICMAVIANNIDVVKYLLSKKVRVNIAAENGGPLHLACSIRSFELTKILVDGGADVNFVTSGNIGTPLHSTYDWIFDGEDEVIGGEVNGQNGVNDPIHIDDQEVDEVNGQDKAYNQDTKNDRENLFRINPRERAKKQIIEYLIEAGAGVNVFGGRFGYPLNAACLHGTPDIIKSLLDKRARLDVEDGMGRRPVHLAAYRTLDHFELTLDGATNLSVKDKLERTPLHYAVMSGQVELVRRVLDLSVGLVNEPDCDKWTPILWAARKCGRWVTANDELPEVIELLVSAGADLWVRGEGLNGEWSPLKVARYYGAEGKIVELLTPKSKQRSSDESWEDYFHLSKKAVRRHNVYCDSCLLVSYRANPIVSRRPCLSSHCHQLHLTRTTVVLGDLL